MVWQDGQIMGDIEAQSVFEAEAELAAPGAVGPPGGPYVAGGPEEYLNSALACYTLMVERVFEEVHSVTGDVPIPPPTPDGAVP